MFLKCLKSKVHYVLFLGGLFSIFLTSFCEAQLQPRERTTVEIFEKVSPSVAFIKNATLQWDWFSGYVYEIPRGAGSGFVWDSQGHIVTNFHVI